MRRETLPPILLLTALLATAFPGCASRPGVSLPTPPGKPSAAPPPAVPPDAGPPVVSPAAKAFADGMSALQEGKQERALDLFSAAWKEMPGHAGVAGEFDGALLALKRSGDAAFAQGKWEEAGKRWMGTLRFITHPAANWRGYPFTRSGVQANVDRLSASLMEKALTEYRRGDVESAIADWKAIISYDPGHEEAARSVRTASKQLETLKKMPPGK